MAYRIDYDSNDIRRKRTDSSLRIRTLITVSFLIFAWMAQLLWPAGREQLVNTFLPGDATMTQIAYLNLLERLRQGCGMAESLTVFCREILYEIV